MFSFFEVLPCSLGLLLSWAIPGSSSFCSLWRPLTASGFFRLSRLGCTSPVLSCSCFSCLNFGHSLGLPFVLFLALFFGRSLRGFCWLSSGHAPFVTWVSCSALPLSYCFFAFPSALFLCLYTPLLALSQTALGFLVGAVIAEASFLAVRSLPFAPSLSSYSISSYSSYSSPRSSLRANGVRGVTAYAGFSTMLLWLHP